jgi:hypothetical protein
MHVWGGSDTGEVGIDPLLPGAIAGILTLNPSTADPQGSTLIWGEEMRQDGPTPVVYQQLSGCGHLLPEEIGLSGAGCQPLTAGSAV